MSNPFQEQFLKAGLVTKDQVKKANQKPQRKKQAGKKKPKVESEAAKQARLAAQKKAERDRELNQKREEQMRQRAISSEIDQLISKNMIKRDEKCELAYNFEHRNKVHRIYVNDEMKQGLIEEKFSIARIEGRYEMIPAAIATKIREKNEKRLVVYKPAEETTDKDDPYADYQIPDDLMW